MIEYQLFVKILFVFACLSEFVFGDDSSAEYNNRWTVKITGGSRKRMEVIARKEGFTVADHQVDVMDDIFFLIYPNHPVVMNFTDHYLTGRLNSYEEIVYVNHQKLLHYSLHMPKPTVSGAKKLALKKSIKAIVNEAIKDDSTEVELPSTTTESDQDESINEDGKNSELTQRNKVNDFLSRQTSKVKILFRNVKYTLRNWIMKIMEKMSGKKAASMKDQKQKRDFIRKLINQIFVHYDAKLLKNAINAITCPRSGFDKGVTKYQDKVNDPAYPAQWYIHQCQQANKLAAHYDLGVVPVWDTGNYGQGINILFVDSGMETTHNELKDNYSPFLGLDVVDDDDSPDPGEEEYGYHGTMVASIAAMKANNGECGVGIAHEATIGAVRYLSDAENKHGEEVTARALLFRSDYVHIVSNSWSVPDNGYSLIYPTDMISNTLKIAGEKLINIFACGNGKDNGDHCGVDMYAASIYTITVASANSYGKENDYSERCATVMVTAYSGVCDSLYNVVAADINNGCTLGFGGTSAATPMISAITALTLKENAQLSLRDMAHLFAWNNQVAPLQSDSDLWYQNTAGFWVSDTFGFGLANAKGMTVMAKEFVSVPPMHTCVMNVEQPADRKFSPGKPIPIYIDTDGCKGQPSEVKYIEYVQVQVFISYPYRGALEVKLTSPTGLYNAMIPSFINYLMKTVVKFPPDTEAILLSSRFKDYNEEGLKGWTFSSLMSWGEKPEGRWVLKISAKVGKWGHAVGSIKGVFAAVHGTEVKPEHYLDGPRKYDPIKFKKKK